MHRQEMEETGELCLQSESTAYEEDVSMAESREGTELTISMSETDGESGDMSSKVFSIGASFVVPTRTKRPSGSRGTSPAHVRERRNPRQQAELIQAKSKVVQLETEVLVLQRSLKRARIEEEEREESLSSAQQMDRVYKLDQERCQLLQELSETKKRLVSTEKELTEKTSNLEEKTETFYRETGSLQEQLSETQSAVASLTNDNTNLRKELERLRLQIELETVGIDEVQASYDKSVVSLKARVQELEMFESQLLKAQTEIQRLERKLRQGKYDSHLVETMMAKVMRYDELERQNRLLAEENKTLRGKSDNVDLLRYKVQKLEETCRLYEGQKTDLVRLEVENSELREKLSTIAGEGLEEGGKVMAAGLGATGSSAPALLYRIQDLQHKELILLNKQGELETRVKLSERVAADASEKLKAVKGQLEQEQEESRSREERLQRLERKLVFVTKERDGCVNVLKSYKQDGGVDAILKERVSELEQHLMRADDRISELERELEDKASTVGNNNSCKT